MKEVNVNLGIGFFLFYYPLIVVVLLVVFLRPFSKLIIISDMASKGYCQYLETVNDQDSTHYEKVWKRCECGK